MQTLENISEYVAEYVFIRTLNLKVKLTQEKQDAILDWQLILIKNANVDILVFVLIKMLHWS